MPVVLAIASLNFLLIKMAPGDAADILAGQIGQRHARVHRAAAPRVRARPAALEQFLRYIGRLRELDLGTSLIQQQPVFGLIVERLPATLLLMVTAIVVAIASGMALGVVAARRQGGWVDNVISVVALLVYATPAFWLGLMLIVFFSIHARPPALGRDDAIGGAHDPARHGPRRGAPPGAARAHARALLRGDLCAAHARLDARGLQPGLHHHRACEGAFGARVAWSHAARNALLPVVTLAGLQLGHLLGGSVLIETVFAWPGLGRLVFDALQQRDLNLLLGILFVSSVVVVLANLAVDLLYGLLDPRIAHK